MYQANLFDTETPKAQTQAHRIDLDDLADIADGTRPPRRTGSASQANPWLAERARYAEIAKAQYAEARKAEDAWARA